MPAGTYTDIFRRFNRELSNSWNPVFEHYAWEDAAELAAACRETFTFMRRHSDRRYSSSSLMRILNAADRLDAAVEAGVGPVSADTPHLAIARVPFAFDPETEVKTGGVVAVAFTEPGGKTMLAVHTGKRRSRLGRAMLFFVENYCYGNPQLWVHRANSEAMHFLIDAEFSPWEINSRGALLFSRAEPAGENDAVEYEDENRLDAAIARRDRNRPRPARQVPSRPFVRNNTATGIREALASTGEEAVQLRRLGCSLQDIEEAQRLRLTPGQLIQRLEMLRMGEQCPVRDPVPEAGPQLERVLAEEEHIARNTRQAQAIVQDTYTVPNTGISYQVIQDSVITAEDLIRQEDTWRTPAQDEEYTQDSYSMSDEMDEPMPSLPYHPEDPDLTSELEFALERREADLALEENLYGLTETAFGRYLNRRLLVARDNGNTQEQQLAMINRLRCLRAEQRTLRGAF